MARAKDLLNEHNLPLPMGSDSSSHANMVVRMPFLSKITLEIETCVIRAAFSHIPLWHSVMDDLQLVSVLNHAFRDLLSWSHCVALLV